MSLEWWILEEFDTALALRWECLLRESVDAEPAPREDIEAEIAGYDIACLGDALEIADWIIDEHGLTRRQAEQLHEYARNRCGEDEPLVVGQKCGRGRPPLTPTADLARSICARRARRTVRETKRSIKTTRPGRRVTTKEARGIVAEKIWPTGRKPKHTRGQHLDPIKDLAELEKHRHHDDFIELDD